MSEGPLPSIGDVWATALGNELVLVIDGPLQDVDETWWTVVPVAPAGRYRDGVELDVPLDGSFELRPNHRAALPTAALACRLAAATVATMAAPDEADARATAAWADLSVMHEAAVTAAQVEAWRFHDELMAIARSRPAALVEAVDAAGVALGPSDNAWPGRDAWRQARAALAGEARIGTGTWPLAPGRDGVEVVVSPTGDVVVTGVPDQLEAATLFCVVAPDLAISASWHCDVPGLLVATELVELRELALVECNGAAAATLRASLRMLPPALSR